MGDAKASSGHLPKPVPSWLNSTLWQSPDRTLSSSTLEKNLKPKSNTFDEKSDSAGEVNPLTKDGSVEQKTPKKAPSSTKNDWEGTSKLVYGRGNILNGPKSDSTSKLADNGIKDRQEPDHSTTETKHRQVSSDSGTPKSREPTVAAPVSRIPKADPFGSPPRSFSPEDNRHVSERKIARFYSELAQQKIQIGELRRLAMTGIPDEGSLRATTWKLLLGYLPRKTDDWDTELAAKRAEYDQFRKELIVNPTELARRKEAAAGRAPRVSLFDEDLEMRAGNPEWSELRGIDISCADHPLSQGDSSVWHQFFKDTELVEQIDRDVKRTHPDLPFFSSDDGSALETQDAMRRILFVFAKLNPGIRYVQGMNEVLAPLLFVFKTDPDKETSTHAEADAFYCFSLLLGDFRDHFCQQLDNSVVGIRSTIARMAGLLRTHDAQLWRHMEFVCKVNPQFYSFRWITLLLTQDFAFADVLRIWDSLLANMEGPLEILLRVCCAMLICVRERLLAGDFTTNLKLLQKYPPTNIDHLIQTAERLKN